MLVLIAVINAMSLSVVGALDVGQRPNLSGHWVEQSQPVPTKGLVPICGGECTITHTGNVLVVEDRVGRHTYELDGVPATTKYTFSGKTGIRTVTATWEAETLVINTATKGADSTTETKLTARLFLREGRLVIAGSRPDPSGSQSKFEVEYRRD